MGDIVQALQQQFDITAAEMFTLDAVNAGEFLEVYRGVLPSAEFSGLLDELTSGKFLEPSKVSSTCSATPCLPCSNLCRLALTYISPGALLEVLLQ